MSRKQSFNSVFTMLLLFCLGYSFLKRRFFCNITRWKCSWCRKMTNSVESYNFSSTFTLTFFNFQDNFLWSVNKIRDECISQNLTINPAKTQCLKYVTLSPTRLLNKNKWLALTCHAPCYDYITLSMYFTYLSTKIKTIYINTKQC